MAVNNRLLDYALSQIKNRGFSLKGLRMCELGNQQLLVNGEKFKTAKEYFLSKGVEHISIDINGRDGALPLNLAKPIINSEFLGYFDVITNFGTAEHVSNQYECFCNIHNFCRCNGLIIHLAPLVGSWPLHCVRYYSPLFFEKLSEANNYSILKKEIVTIYENQDSQTILISLEKTKKAPFINKKQFSKLPINYASRIYNLSGRILRKLGNMLSTIHKLYMLLYFNF